MSSPQIQEQEITEVQTSTITTVDKYKPISTTPYIIVTVIFLIILIGLSIYAIVASINKSWPFNTYKSPVNSGFYRPYGEVIPLTQEEINARNTSIECFYRNSPCEPTSTKCLRDQERPAALKAWIASIGGDSKVVCPPVPTDFVWHVQSST